MKADQRGNTSAREARQHAFARAGVANCYALAYLHFARAETRKNLDWYWGDDAVSLAHWTRQATRSKVDEQVLIEHELDMLEGLPFGELNLYSSYGTALWERWELLEYLSNA